MNGTNEETITMAIRLALASQNTEKCFEHKVFGLTSGSAKVLGRFIEMIPGDILVFYKAKEGIAGIWKVVSEQYKDTIPVWQDDVYPDRVKIEPVIALKPEQYVDAKTMVDDLEMVTHPIYWGIAFRENLKEISQKDYELIKSRLMQSLKK